MTASAPPTVHPIELREECTITVAPLGKPRLTRSRSRPADVAGVDELNRFRESCRGNVDATAQKFVVEVATVGECDQVQGLQVIDAVFAGRTKDIELVIAGDGADAELHGLGIVLGTLEDLLR